MSDEEKEAFSLLQALEDQNNEDDDEYEIEEDEETLKLLHQHILDSDVIAVDTETTGLPISRNYRNPHWYKKHPYIVQISWILFDTDSMKIINTTDYIVKVPDHIGISESSTAVHGITKERSMNEGVPIQKIIFEFEFIFRYFTNK